MRYIIGLLSVTIVSAAAVSFADEPPSAPDKKPPDALDKQLLDELDDDLLDDLPSDDATKITLPTKSDGKPKDNDGSKDDGLDEQLLDELNKGEDVGEETSKDPAERIKKQMRAAAGLIGKQRSDERTQKIQQRIVADLDELIKQIQRSKSKRSSSSSSPKSAKGDKPKPDKGEGDGSGTTRKPARDSVDELRDAKTLRVVVDRLNSLIEARWGHLPERERKAMLQNPNDKFLPKYSIEIGRYFRGLVDQEREER